MTILVRVIIEVSEDAIRIFGDGDVARFGREMYEAAIVRWFDAGKISQGKASELLGISRPEFHKLLFRHKVSLIQLEPEEIAQGKF